MNTVGVVAIARVTFDLAEAARQVDRAWSTLLATGAELRGSTRLVTDVAAIDGVIERLERPDVVVILQATFADATMAIRLSERLDVPIVCWSFPEARTGNALRLNSLCGANLAAYSLRRRNSSAAFVDVDPQDCDAGDRVSAAIGESTGELSFQWPGLGERTGENRLTAAAVRRVGDVLAAARIGVIGEYPDGFEPCAFDPLAVTDLTGAVTDRVPIAELFAAADAVAPDDLEAIRDRTAHDVQLPPSIEGLDNSLRLYGGLRRLATERRWGAVATRCWPECVSDYGGAICAPQAMLTADGIPAMCEADVYGGLTALILRTIAGTDPFVTDVVDADRSDGTSAIWHCGQASINLADPVAARRGIVHPTQGRALLHEFPLRPGRVTVARLSQARGHPAMVIAGGELLHRPRPFAGTCGVLRWDLPIDDVMRTVFDIGLEHHLAIVAGEHRDVLVALAADWGIPVLRLGHDHGRRHPARLPADVLP